MRFRSVILSTIIGLSVFGAMSAPAQASDAPACYNKYGYDTTTIKAVQTALKVGVDGHLGPQTCKALIAFQQTRGSQLTVNGVYGYLGPNTTAALGITSTKAVAQVPMRQTAAATTIDPTQGSWPLNCRAWRACIVVDQAKNRAWFGSAGQGIIATSCVVDNANKLSKGPYRIGFKQATGITDASNKLLLDNFMQISGDIAFHKVPIKKANGSSIHSQGALCEGWRESGGCIRVSNEFSDIIYAQAPVWTYVFVV